MAGALKRGVAKLIVRPLAKRFIAFLEGKGCIYPEEADDFRDRLSRFMKAMIDLETGEGQNYKRRSRKDLSPEKEEVRKKVIVRQKVPAQPTINKRTGQIQGKGPSSKRARLGVRRRGRSSL